MKNNLDYYHSEIFEYIYSILKKYIQVKDDISYKHKIHYELQYLIVRYIIEYNSNFTFKRYNNNQNDFLNNLLFNKNYNFYNFFYDYFINIQNNIYKINKNSILIKASKQNICIDKNNNEMFSLFKDEIKSLEIETYKFNYEFNDIYHNTISLINEINKQIENNFNKDIFKDKPLLLIYQKLNILDDIYLKKHSINRNFDYQKEIYKEYKNKIIKKTSIKEIKESDIEDFLIKNIEIINPDYKVIGKQLKVKDGIIDILCQDKYNDFIIIELKNRQTKSIVWQSLYYPEALKTIKNIKNQKIKFIAFCPNFNDVIHSVLKKINYVEMIQYKVVLELNSNNIVDLIVEKKN